MLCMDENGKEKSRKRKKKCNIVSAVAIKQCNKQRYRYKVKQAYDKDILAYFQDINLFFSATF